MRFKKNLAPPGKSQLSGLPDFYTDFWASFWQPGNFHARQILYTDAARFFYHAQLQGRHRLGLRLNPPIRCASRAWNPHFPYVLRFSAKSSGQNAKKGCASRAETFIFLRFYKDSSKIEGRDTQKRARCARRKLHFLLVSKVLSQTEIPKT